MMPTSTTERKPSEVTDAFWLCAQGPPGRPNVVGQGGKWLVFVSHKYVDTVWAQIKQSTEAGRLGPAAKVATARPNSNARDPRSRVICVYTYDWKDEADVKRVREELRRLGIIQKIPYKADADTQAGKYSVRGDSGIAKYYE